MADIKSATTNVSDVVRTAYNRLAMFAYQPKLYFDQFADVKWYTGANDPMPGNVVTFTKFSNLAAATSEINESVDIDAVPITDTQVSITLKEYGNVVTTTEKLRVTSLTNIDTAAARVVGNNMGDSVDQICATTVSAGTNVIYPSGVSARVGINDTTNHVLKATLVRQAYTKLRAANAPTVESGHYICIAHPHALHDLRAETGSGSWRAPREYVDPAAIYNGEYGEFEGFRFMATSNGKIFADSSGTIDTYATICVGAEAYGKGVGVAPEVRITGPFDKLGRLANIGWYTLQGYGIIRQESLQRVETLASLGANT